jgi:hypothetical protein
MMFAITSVTDYTRLYWSMAKSIKRREHQRSVLIRIMKSIEDKVARLSDTVSSWNVVNAKLSAVLQDHDRSRLVYQAKMLVN